MIHCGENLEIMRSMESESVDLIATDPPFNTGLDFGAYDDRWKWNDTRASELLALRKTCNAPALNAVIVATEKAHSQAMAAFLCFLGIRLVEAKRLLKPTGSIWLHCDQAANSYIRLMMDSIFGAENQRNEIAWCYTGPSTNKARQFSRKHDTIFWYSKSNNWVFNIDKIRVPYKRLNTGGGFHDRTARMDANAVAEYEKRGKLPETWWTNFCPVGRLKNERIGYPTQKPTALYSRIIEASCPEGGIVFDPFAGSGTTLVAAKGLGREFIGIDINPEAVKVAEERLAEVML